LGTNKHSDSVSSSTAISPGRAGGKEIEDYERKAGVVAAYSQAEGGNPMYLIWFILIGLVAGWLAGKIMKGKGFGVVGNIVIGVIGALIGGFLFRLVGISTNGGLIGSLIVATIGAVVLLWLLRFFKKAA
jgi:uncharacterized membrane protein YeaQ/YmgE (transglycosylase-associated protein family)